MFLLACMEIGADVYRFKVVVLGARRPLVVRGYWAKKYEINDISEFWVCWQLICVNIMHLSREL